MAITCILLLLLWLYFPALTHATPVPINWKFNQDQTIYNNPNTTQLRTTNRLSNRNFRYKLNTSKYVTSAPFEENNASPSQARRTVLNDLLTKGKKTYNQSNDSPPNNNEVTKSNKNIKQEINLEADEKKNASSDEIVSPSTDAAGAASLELNTAISSWTEKTTKLTEYRIKNVSSSDSIDIDPIQSVQPSTVVHLNDPPWNNGPNVQSDLNYQSRAPVKKQIDNPATVEALKPGLVWKVAKREWGVAWDVHVYLAGSLFIVLSIYSLFGLLRLRTFTHLFTRGYFMAVSFLMLLMGTTRATYLLCDPYNSHESYPSVLALFLYNIGHPCLSAAFAILFLALLKETSVSLIYPKLQKPNILAVLIFLDLSLSVLVDIVIVTLNSTVVIEVVCHAVSLIWSMCLCIFYFISFRRLYTGALKKQGEMMRITFTKLHIDGADLPNKLPKPTIALAVKIILIIAILEFILVGLKIYGIVFVYGLLVVIRPQPWLWWAYHLSSRIIEFIMGITMSFVGTQPLRHFESNEKCCKCPVKIHCKKVRNCWRSEKYDFEAHSHYYANPQGMRSTGFLATVNVPRRWSHTNSLPTFRSLPTENNSILSMRNIPQNRTRDNYTRAHTLVSCHRPNKTISHSTHEGLDSVQRVTEGTRRPPSMLFKENGFIRFRKDSDPPQSMEDSEDDEDINSLKANAGSSIQSLTEDDVVQNSLSPFFHTCYRSRFKSKCSLATTDNSVDLSIDQLSHLNSRQCLSNSALDAQARKYGSTCSSESAANSFDVTFYLHTPLRPPEGFETEEVSSIEAHEAILRSGSPVVFQSIWRTDLPLNLNLETECSEKVTEASTKDITPDSAVCLDLHLPPPTSHSLGDLTGPQRLTPFFQPSKAKKTSRNFLNKLKGSTFSLNAAINGYELLESDDTNQPNLEAETNRARNKVQRSSSDRRPGSVQEQRYFTSLADMRVGGGSASYGHLYHVDSGMLGDYAVNDHAIISDNQSTMKYLFKLRKDLSHVSD